PEEIYRSWSDEKLVRAITEEADTYEPASIPVMQRILNERGLSEEQFQAIVANIRAERDDDVGRDSVRRIVDAVVSSFEWRGADNALNRIRGFLLSFIIWLAWTSIGYLVWVPPRVSVMSPDVIHRMDNVAWSLQLSAGVYGLCCVWMLARRRSHAIEHARIWLVLNVFISVAWGIFLYLSTGHAPVRAFVSPPIAAIVGTLYLIRSKRVARIYRNAVPRPT
ncbi:MAG TPA: DUF2569 family protein, partial [Vicinamibacterales bacterium]|nr:DUF2569 family protein [Vicinamibacterales bacterium]